MQLIQIGQSPILTVHQMIDQMAVRQFSEIEELKQAALARHANSTARRSANVRSASHRTRCQSAAR